MTVPRIYFPLGVKESSHFELGKESLRYVKSVLRMKRNERLIVFDGTGWEYETIIRRISAEGIFVEIVKKSKSLDRRIHITLLQALPKANKMDFIVQKATEIGADRIVPFISARSVPIISPEKIPLKITRWQNIAIEAARQCGRADIPEIKGIISFKEAILLPGREALKMIFWEEESERSMKQVLNDKQYEGIRDVFVVVGPEGGFTKEEVVNAGQKEFVSVSLGRQVLKVETAVLSILSIIQYEKGIFSEVFGGGRKG